MQQALGRAMRRSREVTDALGLNYNHHSSALMLLRSLLPRIPVHVAMDDGLGDRQPLQLLEKLGLRTD